MSAFETVDVNEIPADAAILDVREDDEWQAGHAPGAVHVPLGDVPSRLADLPETDEPLPVICRSGGRSLKATAFLAQSGFDPINVLGGMGAWADADKPMVSETDDTPSVK